MTFAVVFLWLPELESMGGYSFHYWGLSQFTDFNSVLTDSESRTGFCNTRDRSQTKKNNNTKTKTKQNSVKCLNQCTNRISPTAEPFSFTCWKNTDLVESESEQFGPLMSSFMSWLIRPDSYNPLLPVQAEHAMVRYYWHNIRSAALTT